MRRSDRPDHFSLYSGDFKMISPFLFLLGAVLGAFVNWFVDRFCWTPRFRSPWRPLPPLVAVPSKKKRKESTPFQKIPLDFVPIVGWISLSRLGAYIENVPEAERPSGLEDRNFWLRPFFVELFAAFGIIWLFWWEVDQQALLPIGLLPEPWSTCVLRFGAHVLLFMLLLAASLIDFDDMIIPDALTVPGTILGLILAAVLPQTLLPATEFSFQPGQVVITPHAVPLNVCSPHPAWPEKATFGKAALAVGLWWFWCFAMLDRVWYTKLSFRKAAALFFRRLKRSPATPTCLKMAIIFPGTFAFVDWLWSGERFHTTILTNSLLSALIGMATGMCLIWIARLIAGFVLGREAMGFGDVTLMGMIGAFVGWQNTILIFFLAPCIGLGFGVVNYLAGRGKELPYGPFLCLATAFVVIAWQSVWDYVTPIFEFGPVFIAIAMGVCLLLLGVMLWTWRLIKQMVFK